MAGQKKGGGNRKTGRNKTFCLGYAASGRREVNKLKKFERHNKAQPNDEQAVQATRSRESKRINVLRSVEWVG